MTFAGNLPSNAITVVFKGSISQMIILQATYSTFNNPSQTYPTTKTQYKSGHIHVFHAFHKTAVAAQHIANLSIKFQYHHHAFQESTEFIMMTTFQATHSMSHSPSPIYPTTIIHYHWRHIKSISNVLTHSGWMMHIHVSKLGHHGSDNGFSPNQRRAIISTITALLFIHPREQIILKFELKFLSYHSRKCVWKCCLESGGHFVSASMCNTITGCI